MTGPAPTELEGSTKTVKIPEHIPTSEANIIKKVSEEAQHLVGPGFTVEKATPAASHPVPSHPALERVGAERVGAEANDVFSLDNLSRLAGEEFETAGPAHRVVTGSGTSAIQIAREKKGGAVGGFFSRFWPKKAA